ncbi:MFS transporter [Candidatus Peregrinibacteria bacterium]|nr:MFS transporter [Candidatus Peregrinibacteria bacterium]
MQTSVLFGQVQTLLFDCSEQNGGCVMNTDSNPKRALPSRIVLTLSLGFFFIFFGVHSVERYAATYLGQELAATIFMLVFGSLLLSDFASPVVISGLGQKKTLMLGAVIYAVLPLVVATKSAWLLYAYSLPMGFATAITWNSAFALINTHTTETNEGSSFGLLYMLYGLGSALGLVVMGLSLKIGFSLKEGFLAVPLLMVIGIVLLATIRDNNRDVDRVYLRDVAGILKDTDLLRLITVPFTVFFLYATLTIAVTLHIEELGGSYLVGFISAWPFLLLAFSMVFGLLHDAARDGKRVLISCGYLLGIGGLFLLIAVPGSIVAVGFAVLLISISSAMLMVAWSLLPALWPQSRLLAATAIFTCTDDLGGFAGFAVNSALSFSSVYIASTVVILGSAALILKILRNGFNTLKERIHQRYL